MPVKREPSGGEVVKTKKLKMNLSEEQRVGKTLLTPWKDLRKAGIEVSAC